MIKKIELEYVEGNVFLPAELVHLRVDFTKIKELIYHGNKDPGENVHNVYIFEVNGQKYAKYYCSINDVKITLTDTASTYKVLSIEYEKRTNWIVKHKHTR